MIRKTPLFWIFKHMRKRLLPLLVMSAAHVFTAFLGVLFALGTRQVIDCAVNGTGQEFIRACLLQGSIITGILICLTTYRYLHERLLAQLDRDWKKDLLHSLLRGDYASVSSYHSAELINRLNNDVKAINEGMVTALPNLASMITKLISATIVLTALEPWFTLVLICAGLFFIALTALLRYYLKGMNKQVSEQDGKVSGFLQETFEKLLLVQALDISAEMEHRTDLLLNERYEAQRKRKNITLFANTSVSLLSYGAGFVALVWCSAGLLNGTMSFGSLTAVTQLVSQIQGPFINLSSVLPQYIAMIAAAERLMELTALEQEPLPPLENVSSIYNNMHSICGNNLKFSYDRDLILEEGSFSLPKGSFAVITGPSGVGKSTLLKLMLGVFHAESGELFLDCKDTHIPLNRSTRRLFAYVPQGNVLLSGTLRENLTLVRPDATEEQIQEAVYISAMNEFLPQLPQGLDTVIGENGAGLSEGQAQRLAIARAILTGAPILLLDEGTSALDAETEQLVLERIHSLQRYTCIAVTHRPAAIELADYHLVVREQTINIQSK